MVSGEKKRISLITCIKLVFLLLAGCIALLMTIAPAKSLYATVVEKNTGQHAQVSQQKAAINPQQNYQAFAGNSNSGNRALLIGHNQGNTGNQAVNQGFSQDNSINAGNEVSGQRKNIQYQQNIQNFEGGSGGGGSATFIGDNQGNSGNEGFNTGFNQDNANNSGNQVNNQGDIIGTQINNQGSTVNNDGSSIANQVNFINLFPPVQLNLRLGTGPHLAVGLNGG